jgi:arylsulfatase
MPAAAAGVYNILRDPREQHPLIGHSLWSAASFQDMVKRHAIGIKNNPHNKLGKGRPYGGIENLRPESIETVEIFMSWQQ